MTGQAALQVDATSRRMITGSVMAATIMNSLDTTIAALVADQRRLVLVPGVEHVARARLDDGRQLVGLQAAPRVRDLARC